MGAASEPVPHEYKCPIFYDWMTTPVQLFTQGDDGSRRICHTFDGHAIIEWLHQSDRCPLDQRTVVKLIPDKELQKKIIRILGSVAFQQKHLERIEEARLKEEYRERKARFREAYRLGDMDTALREALGFTNDKERYACIIAILIDLSITDPDRAIEILTHHIAIENRDDTISLIIQGQVKLLNTPPEEHTRREILDSLELLLPLTTHDLRFYLQSLIDLQRNNIDLAIANCLQIQDPHYKDLALETITTALVDDREFEDAYDLLDQFTNPDKKDYLCHRILLEIYTRNLSLKRFEKFDFLLNAALKISKEIERQQQLLLIAQMALRSLSIRKAYHIFQHLNQTNKRHFLILPAANIISYGLAACIMAFSVKMTINHPNSK